jgi:hypothetical protein
MAEALKSFACNESSHVYPTRVVAMAEDDSVAFTGAGEAIDPTPALFRAAGGLRTLSGGSSMSCISLGSGSDSVSSTKTTADGIIEDLGRLRGRPFSGVCSAGRLLDATELLNASLAAAKFLAFLPCAALVRTGGLFDLFTVSVPRAEASAQSMNE